MKKVRFLFYISTDQDQFLSKAIAWWSGLWNKKTIPTSHEEVEFCDRMPSDFPSLVKTSTPETLSQSGVCFSSATRGDFTGTRFAPADEILKHPEHWAYIEVDIEDAQEQKMFEAASSIIDRPYDYLAIVGFCLPFHIQDKHSWFCSECVNWVAHKAGLLDKAYRTSPLATVNLMLEKNFKPLLALADNTKIA